MNTKLINVFMFAAGAAIGSVVTWKFVKTKYEKIAQEEIDSVKEVFSHRFKSSSKPIDDVEPIENTVAGIRATIKPSYEKPDLFEYAKILGREGYTECSESTVEEKGGSSSEKRPYVISPDDFGQYEDDGYDSISLIWYEDGVLADDQDHVIDNVDEIIGLDNLKRFGEYENDAVHIRNDERREDYEILLSLKKFDEDYAGEEDITDYDDDPYKGGDE